MSGWAVAIRMQMAPIRANAFGNPAAETQSSKRHDAGSLQPLRRSVVRVVRSSSHSLGGHAMNPRERVARTTQFQQPDRVTIDLGGMKTPGIAAAAYNPTSVSAWGSKGSPGCRTYVS
jgi:hypothetical protein